MNGVTKGKVPFFRNIQLLKPVVQRNLYWMVEEHELVDNRRLCLIHHRHLDV
jgi:hypothetical protein